MGGEMTLDGQPTRAATYNGARPGTHYLRIRSVAAGSADPYTITISIKRVVTTKCILQHGLE
jgi:hypothetical protein